MTIKVNLGLFVWLLVLTLVIASYPTNIWLMQNEWGWFDNSRSLDEDDRMDRGAALIFSPLTVPVTLAAEGIGYLIDMTIEGEE